MSSFYDDKSNIEVVEQNNIEEIIKEETEDNTIEVINEELEEDKNDDNKAVTTSPVVNPSNSIDNTINNNANNNNQVNQNSDNNSTEEAHEHVIVVDVAKQATCTEAALSEGSHCSVCGEVIVAQIETSPALGHDFSSGNRCSRCGEEKDEEENDITLPPMPL